MWEVKHVQRPLVFTTNPLKTIPISSSSVNNKDNFNNLWLWNRFDFNEISEYCEYSCLGEVAVDGNVMSSFNLILPTCEAQHRCRILNLPVDIKIISLTSSVGDNVENVKVKAYQSEVILTLKVKNQEGFEVSFDQFEIDKSYLNTIPPIIPTTTSSNNSDNTVKIETVTNQAVQAVQAGIKEGDIMMECNDTCYVIDGKEGLLKSIKITSLKNTEEEGQSVEEELLSDYMLPNFWRALTDNELGWGAEKKLKEWHTAGQPTSLGGSLSCKSVQVN